MKIVAPSLLAADFANLDREIERAGSADWLHLDIMDGVFVPNISFGIPVLQSIRKCTSLVFDVHLMIQNPIDYIDRFAEVGADIIVFHLESSSNPVKTIEKIKSHKKKAGISVKPDTPFDEVKPFIHLIDVLLIMTVNPGFGGQSFMYETLDKIKAAKKEIVESGNDVIIEVDGGINHETALLCAKAGADAFVAGSYVFSCKDPKERIKELRYI